MKQILLTRGRYATVDDSDVELIQAMKWQYHRDGWGKEYAVHKARLAGKFVTVYMHRLIMGARKGQYVDHKDNDGLNNRRDNLRIATMRQNIQNSKKKTGCSSAYKGVTLNKALSLWRASVNNQFLGYFEDERHAALAYDLNAKYLYGEFARTNFTAVC